MCWRGYVVVGLDVVGEVVIIQNVSRFCDDIYECVANNGILQPVSRQIRVSVQCKFWRYTQYAI